MRISDCSSDVCSSDLTVVAAKGVRPDQFTLAQVDGDELPFLRLKSAIADLEAAGRPVDALKGVLWHKISGPLSAILMPLLGAVAAFGLARSGKLFVRAILGMALDRKSTRLNSSH